MNKRMATPLTRAQRQQAVEAFCEDCVWVRSVRTQFAQLFESGGERHRLLAESAKTFFDDLNQIFREHILLQQTKLTDPASSGGDKDNLTAEYLLTLEWTRETKAKLVDANKGLKKFRSKINDARRKLVAHSDLKARLGLVSLGIFTENEESDFWVSLQSFASTAHEEAVGGPFELEVSLPDGDALSLLHRLADAADYDDMITEDSSILAARSGKRRNRDL